MNLETKRLRLRQWTTDDLDNLVALNSDAEVMKYFPSILTVKESEEKLNLYQQQINEKGWGFWAAEVKSTLEFVGIIGLMNPKDTLPIARNIEIGWRLTKASWGKGYATEAANTSLEYAFEVLNEPEVVAITTLNNQASKRVMERIGMHDTNSNFMHPELPSDSPLAEHVLYKITK